MSLPPTWSRRKRLREKEAAGAVDVYQYTECSVKLRHQIDQIFEEMDERVRGFERQVIYGDAVSVLRKEFGVPSLSKGFHPDQEFRAWLLSEPDIDHLLDGIEIYCRLAWYYFNRHGATDEHESHVSELNARMLEDEFGFQLEGNQIIQISDQFIHSEVTLPVLGLLADPAFAAANQEFRQAHAEFRDGDYEDSIHDCCNAFESVLKVILTQKGWTFSPNDTASKLIAVAFDNDLIPSYLQTEFTGLRTILESGVPTVRNKTAGHGAGTSTRNIPKYLAAFQLHQTAAAILLLFEAAQHP